MFAFKFPQFLYETPDVTVGAGSGAPAQGNGQPAPVQPTGQGQPDPSTGGFNWGLFPDVAEEVRPQLEPHLRNVQGHVTRMEQQLAAYKPFTDIGYTPEQVQGIAQFSQAYNQNPVGAAIGLLAQMQSEGLISDDLDLDAVVAIATGQQPPEPPEVPQAQGLPPEIQAYMQQQAETIARLESQVGQLNNGFQQQTQSQQAAQQQAFLTQQLGNMRETLKGEGYPEDAMTDENLKSAIVVARGNVQQAVQNLLAQRSALLQGFVKTNQENRPGSLQTPNGVPTPPAQPRPKSNDPWAEADAGAANFLKKQNAAAAQGT